jgi:hypothetical protein
LVPVTDDDAKHKQNSGAVGSIESRVNGILAYKFLEVSPCRKAEEHSLQF